MVLPTFKGQIAHIGAYIYEYFRQEIYPYEGGVATASMREFSRLVRSLPPRSLCVDEFGAVEN